MTDQTLDSVTQCRDTLEPRRALGRCGDLGGGTPSALQGRMSTTNHSDTEDLLAVIATAATADGDICDIDGDTLRITRELSRRRIPVATIRVEEVTDDSYVQTGWQLEANISRSKSTIVRYMRLVDGHMVDDMPVSDY